jgi:hypothetical protein
MTETKNNEIHNEIETLLKRLCPIFKLYAAVAHEVDSRKMYNILDNARTAVGQLVKKTTQGIAVRFCPRWQVMSSVCKEKPEDEADKE